MHFKERRNCTIKAIVIKRLCYKTHKHELHLLHDIVAQFHCVTLGSLVVNATAQTLNSCAWVSLSDFVKLKKHSGSWKKNVRFLRAQCTKWRGLHETDEIRWSRYVELLMGHTDRQIHNRHMWARIRRTLPQTYAHYDGEFVDYNN